VLDLKNKKRLWIGVAVGALLAAGGVVALVVLLSSQERLPPVLPDESRKDGFTFFNLGADSVYSNRVREALENILGAGVLESPGIIDLPAEDKGFLKDHFPEIYRLHLQLLDPEGARIEHDITRLTFRYALKRNTPFYFVELVFSNHSGNPLFFRIRAKKEAFGIVDEIGAKYGEPMKIANTGDNLPAYFWQRENELFLISERKDRFGQPEFHFMIYFMENLQELIAIEEKDRFAQEEKRQKAARRAF
jgi:hypothetical protein